MDINNELNEFFSLIKQAKQQKKEEIEAQEKEYRDLVGDLSLESVLSEFSAHLKGEDKPKKEVQEVKEERQIQEIDSWLTPQVESSDVKDIVNSIISNNKKPVIAENKANDDVIDRALQILEKVTTKEEVQTNTTNPEISRIRRELENLKNIVAAQGGGGEVNLKYLDDVSITSVANHDVLVYNDSTEKWENEAGVQRLILDVRNNTGSTLAAGTPVYQTGYNSGQDRITIAVADANVPSTMPAKGVVCDPIANNTNGFIVVYGEQEGVDTSAFNVADELYVAPGAGLTNVRPTGSGELVQKIAVVLKKSAGNGAILVYGAGRTNDVPNEISISGIITASALSVSGNISCAGTITYNDVTNVDSLGIGTFRSGVVVNTGTATTALIVNGDARITGILTIGTSSLTLNGTDDSIQVGTGLTIRDTGDAVYSGVITATTFNGNLTGNVTGNVTVATGATISGSTNTIVASTNGSERLRINSSGNIGIGETSPTQKLHLTESGATDLYQRFQNSNGDCYIGLLADGNTVISADTTGDQIIFKTEASERARIDNLGRLIAGASSYAGATRAAFVGSTFSDTSVGIAALVRGSSNPAVNDDIGFIEFTDSAASLGARIAASADGTWGTYNPGRITFSTTGPSTTTPTERARIDSSGRLLVGATSSGCNDQLTVQTGGTSGSQGVLGIRNANATSGLSDGGVLGVLNFGARATEGDDYGYIRCRVDGTPSSGSSYPGRLEFFTTSSGSTSPTERMRISSGGDVTVNDGNLVIGTSGHGIDFSATAGPTNGTGTSELLDDYEEGTWTPTLFGTTTAGTFTPSSTANGGRYVKVGKKITAWFNCNGSLSGAAGEMRISGLPYNSAAGNNSDPSGSGNATYSTGSIQYWAGVSVMVNGPLLLPGSTIMYFHTYTTTSTAGASPSVVNGSHNIHGFLNYYTS